MARKWDQSILSFSHPYELIGAQFQAFFMLLRDEIRHNQEKLRHNQEELRL
jgi:hypothetical protein